MSKFKQFKILFWKEFNYILSDRRTLLTSVVISSLMFPLLFGGIFLIEKFQSERAEEITTVIGITEENQNDPFVLYIEDIDGFDIKTNKTELEQLENGDLLGILEIETEESITEYTYVYNEASNDSSGSLGQLAIAFDQYSAQTEVETLSSFGLNKQDLTPFTLNVDTLQARTDSSSQGELLAFLLPYFILIALVQSSVQYAIEMTAGEKERNTLATTLSMNASSTYIALAKVSVTLILSLSFLILNITSIVIAIALGIGESDQFSLNISLETIGGLALVMLPLSFLISSLMILIGIFARNQKEGQTYAMPLIFGSMFTAFAGNIFDATTPLFVFAIPFLGHVAALRQVVLGSFIWPNLILITITTMLLFFVLIFIVTRLFKREEIIFRV